MLLYLDTISKGKICQGYRSDISLFYRKAILSSPWGLGLRREQRLVRRRVAHIITQFIVLVTVKFKGLNYIQTKLFGMGCKGPGVELIDKGNEDGEPLLHLPPGKLE